MQPSSVEPGFVQQGEVDWVSLSNAVVSMTVGTLTRLSAAGVQEITYVGALQLATRFKLADIGYRRVFEAVQKAQFSPLFANVAYIGFGHRSFLHFLADSVSGTKCIALCASFSEAHGEDLAARVVRSLWTAVGYPEDYQPSLPQFKCLIKACAGVLAPTSFPETMSIMLGPYKDFVKKGKLPHASDPDDIANALHGLFEISKGVRSRITIVGGAECSFIAAISQWLFDFKIHVEDSRGKTLFVSSPGMDQVQVQCLYKEDNQLSSIVISDSTFILGALSELLRYLPDIRLRLVRTRVSWTTCRSRTFGQDFTDLLNLPIALGAFLGGAARIYHALARGEDDVEYFSRELFIHFVEASYGWGFAESIGEVFPELDDPDLLGTVNATLAQDVEKASSSIEKSMSIFGRQCMCTSCCLPDRSRVKAPGQSCHEADRSERLCLKLLAVTLFESISDIASLEFDSELQPTEKGLYHMYEENVKVWEKNQSMWRWITQVALVAHTLGLNNDHPALRRHLKYSSKSKRQNPAGTMASVICLFTGHKLSNAEIETYNYRTAVAENGICVYLDCLESMSTKPQLLRKVHVILGHIASGNRVFDSV